MKTRILSFILVIIGVFVFSACTEHIPNGPTSIETIDGKCLILKKAPFDTVANVIFLEVLGFEHSGNYSWKRKIDGDYKTVSINWINHHDLSPNYAYVILDTIKVPSLYYQIRQSGEQNGGGGLYYKRAKLCHEQLIDAYFHPGEARKIGIKINYHFHPTGIIFTKADAGLTVKYDPTSKDFKEVSPVVKEKTVFSFWLLVTLIIFIVATVKLAKIYHENFLDSEIKEVFWILLTGMSIGTSYMFNLQEFDGLTAVIIFIGCFLGALFSVFFRISLCFQREKNQKIAAMILLPIISSVLIWGTTKQITTVIIYLSIIAVIYLFYILELDYYTRKLSKKFKKK